MHIRLIQQLSNNSERSASYLFWIDPIQYDILKICQKSVNSHLQLPQADSETLERSLRQQVIAGNYFLSQRVPSQLLIGTVFEFVSDRELNKYSFKSKSKVYRTFRNLIEGTGTEPNFNINYLLAQISQGPPRVAYLRRWLQVLHVFCNK